MLCRLNHLLRRWRSSRQKKKEWTKVIWRENWFFLQALVQQILSNRQKSRELHSSHLQWILNIPIGYWSLFRWVFPWMPHKKEETTKMISPLFESEYGEMRCYNLTHASSRKRINCRCTSCLFVYIMPKHTTKFISEHWLVKRTQEEW